jgi:hypothetical protein
MKLKINDILTRNTETIKVLDVFTNTVIVSDSGDHNLAASFYTEKELLEDNWVFPEVKWEPEAGERYFYVNDCGYVSTTQRNSSEYDDSHVSRGNCYQTEALAQEALKRVLAAYKG